jgi:hypothetical protein
MNNPAASHQGWPHFLWLLSVGHPSFRYSLKRTRERGMTIKWPTPFSAFHSVRSEDCILNQEATHCLVLSIVELNYCYRIVGSNVPIAHTTKVVEQREAPAQQRRPSQKNPSSFRLLPRSEFFIDLEYFEWIEYPTTQTMITRIEKTNLHCSGSVARSPTSRPPHPYRPPCFVITRNTHT